MSAVSPSELDRLAALAHLELTAEERELFRHQLGAILGYVETLRAIDTTGVEPTTHVMTPDTVLRDDQARPSLPREDALGNAPGADVAAGLFRVPRVLGG